MFTRFGIPANKSRMTWTRKLAPSTGSKFRARPFRPALTDKCKSLARHLQSSGKNGNQGELVSESTYQDALLRLESTAAAAGISSEVVARLPVPNRR